MTKQKSSLLKKNKQEEQVFDIIYRIFTEGHYLDKESILFCNKYKKWVFRQQILGLWEFNNPHSKKGAVRSKARDLVLCLSRDLLFFSYINYRILVSTWQLLPLQAKKMSESKKNANHSSEIRDLRCKKCSSETLQNLL